MKQHPVPQHIASYEFRLIGDMTIRQFGMLAGSCIVALIFYASPLPGYFKWPLVIFFVLLGIALAFMPIEERPLHRWLIAFFKAIYSPTQFLWKKQPKKPEVFEVAKPQPKAGPPLAEATHPGQTQLTQYLQTLPTEKSLLEQEEESFLEKVANLFQTTKMPVITTTPSPSPPPQPIPTKPTLPPKEEVAIPKPQPKVVPKPVPPPVAPKPPKTKLPKIKIEPKIRKPAVEAKISPHLPFPQTPQTPNLLVGMVLDPKGKIIEGAIIEIRNSKGTPVRALKTNKLGQFRIVTQLKNDTYEIETEKEGYAFNIIKVELKGEPVSPIEIRARGVAHEA